MKSKKHYQITVTDEQYAALKEGAELLGVTVAEFVRRAGLERAERLQKVSELDEYLVQADIGRLIGSLVSR